MHVQPFLKHRFPAQPKSGEPPFLQVAGTEMGVTEPEATFSACFGGAFLMWHPMKYAAMLAEKMEQHGTSAWLVNTGCAPQAPTCRCLMVPIELLHCLA